MENNGKIKQKNIKEYMREYQPYIASLFTRAANTAGFDYLCTILRVQGLTSGHWDAFEEAEDAANEFSKLLRKVSKNKKNKRVAFRLALFLYSHLTEMSAPYEVLANLLRCCQNKPYNFLPFFHPVEADKKPLKILGKRFLPSPSEKIRHLRELAKNINGDKLIEIIDGFFNPDIRNAFFHSDYTLTDDEFKIIEGSRPGEEIIKLYELSDKLTRCFAFYSSFFSSYKFVRKELAKGKRYVRWPNYDVLELLSNNGELTGFKMHYPNGSHSIFERKKYKGTVACNLDLHDLGVNLFVGNLDTYKKASDWYVDGKPFDEYGTRYNEVGFWKPIVFQRDADSIQNKAILLSIDREIQGCLFYTLTTGHKAVEFVIKSTKNLFYGKKFQYPFFGLKKIEITKIQSNNSKFNLYDGTAYFNEKTPESISKSIDTIKYYIKKFSRKDPDLKYVFKYNLYGSIKSEQMNNGTFTITIEGDDPRGILVTNNLGMFPKTDWRIKSEWID